MGDDADGGEVALGDGLEVKHVMRGGRGDLQAMRGDGLEDEGGLGVDDGEKLGGEFDLVVGGIGGDHALPEVKTGGVFVGGEGEGEALVGFPLRGLAGRGGELDVGADGVEVGDDGHQLVGEGAIGFEVSLEPQVAEQREKLGEEGGMQEGFAASEGDGVVEAGLGASEAADGVGELGGGEGIGEVVEGRRGRGSRMAGDKLLPYTLEAGGGRGLLGAGGVAVGAAEVTAGEAEEELALADEEAFALDGGEEFGDGGGHGGGIWWGGG